MPEHQRRLRQSWVHAHCRGGVAVCGVPRSGDHYKFARRDASRRSVVTAVRSNTVSLDIDRFIAFVVASSVVVGAMTEKTTWHC